MTDPRELNAGDYISIDAEAFSGVECRVSDVDVEDIGITETFAVTLVCGSESNWSLVGTTADSTATISELNGDREVSVDFEAITIE